MTMIQCGGAGEVQQCRKREGRKRAVSEGSYAPHAAAGRGTPIMSRRATMYSSVKHAAHIRERVWPGLVGKVKGNAKWTWVVEAAGTRLSRPAKLSGCGLAWLRAKVRFWAGAMRKDERGGKAD
uniref:Uncharacterized protein n=1 Tax=Leersia perrieri TaxID=77586 RepID=A0A0D9WT02_9ORYZ